MMSPKNLLKQTTVTLIFICLIYSNSRSQEIKPGAFSLGIRNTISSFNHTGNIGLGFGGQFRIRISEKLSTEWYADYITTNLNGVGKRTDGHIGWSVMFYLLDEGAFNNVYFPYLIGGHCFDYTLVSSSSESAERWSSAVQVGIGNQFKLSKKLDFTLGIQYMNHLGNDIHVDLSDEAIEITPADGSFSLEGHLLITASVNIFLANLWKQNE